MDAKHEAHVQRLIQRWQAVRQDDPDHLPQFTQILINELMRFATREIAFELLEKHLDEAELSPEYIRRLHAQADIDDAEKQAETFAEEAQRRGLHYNGETDTYTDEDGNALNRYGEKI